MVIRQIGATNVTFECTVTNSLGEQALTQWTIRDFQGEEGLQTILTVVPSTILTGTPNPSPAFETFRNMLVFPEFLEDFDRATLFCGTPSVVLESGQWTLRVFRECVPPYLEANEDVLEHGGMQNLCHNGSYVFSC